MPNEKAFTGFVQRPLLWQDVVRFRNLGVVACVLVMAFSLVPPPNTPCSRKPRAMLWKRPVRKCRFGCLDKTSDDQFERAQYLRSSLPGFLAGFDARATPIHACLFVSFRQRGDYVDIKCNPSIHKGMPFKYYHGRTGIVFNVTKTSLGVRVNKQASRGNFSLCSLAWSEEIVVVYLADNTPNWPSHLCRRPCQQDCVKRGQGTCQGEDASRVELHHPCPGETEELLSRCRWFRT